MIRAQLPSSVESVDRRLDKEGHMLHMVVNTHNPESCAFRGEEEDAVLSGAFEGFEKLGPDNGLEVKAAWVNRAAHEILMVVDAPNAHVIEETLLAAGLVGRTHTRLL